MKSGSGKNMKKANATNNVINKHDRQMSTINLQALT